VARLGLLAAGLAVGARAFTTHEDGQSPPRSTLAGFGIAARTPGELERLRQHRRLSLGIADGYCIGDQARTPAQRLQGVEVRETSEAVTASVRMADFHRRGICFGVGTPGFPTTMTLSRPVGDRAFIEYSGPYAFRLVLIPPVGRAAVRQLVLPIRRDRRQPPPLISTGPACDAVARYFRDVPKHDWCYF
jgi:hypothetical protein